MLVNNRDEKTIVFTKKIAMPRLTWKEESLVIQAVPKKDLIN